MVIGQFDLLPLAEGLVLSLRRVRRGASVQMSQHFKKAQPSVVAAHTGRLAVPLNLRLLPDCP